MLGFYIYTGLIPLDLLVTGTVQTFTAPADALYLIECWGASGGGRNKIPHTEECAGKGAYTYGIIKLEAGTPLYVYVGGAGRYGGGNKTFLGGWNGGGTTGGHEEGGGGGGATDFRLVNGTWNNTDSLKSRIIVSGAGGGTDNYFYGLYANDHAFGYCAGGTTAYAGYGSGAGQTYGYAFGRGGNGMHLDSGGGGSGWYGGSGGSHCNMGGSGGSSYIAGITRYAESSYQQYVFQSGTTISGASWMKSPENSNEQGHYGNGYARVTLYEILPQE